MNPNYRVHPKVINHLRNMIKVTTMQKLNDACEKIKLKVRLIMIWVFVL